MQLNAQSAPPPQPRVFQHSLDWRFLLPISDPAKIHVAFEWEPDLSAALDLIGIPTSNHHFTSDLRGGQKANTHAFVLPFGLPRPWINAGNEEQTGFYRSVRNAICPGGYFLLGFQNFWTPRPDVGYHAPSLSRVASQLHQAGFTSIKFFGALPDLRIPEYIFDLDVQAMRFALQHRFRRKPVLLKALQMLAQTIGWTHASNFFPCYFAIATA